MNYVRTIAKPAPSRPAAVDKTGLSEGREKCMAGALPEESHAQASLARISFDTARRLKPASNRSSTFPIMLLGMFVGLLVFIIGMSQIQSCSQLKKDLGSAFQGFRGQGRMHNVPRSIRDF